jgi:hypothetical protein
MSFMAVWYNFRTFALFHGRLVYVLAIWHMVWPFGRCFGHLVGICFGHLVYVVAICYVISILVYSVVDNLAALAQSYLQKQ